MEWRAHDLFSLGRLVRNLADAQLPRRSAGRHASHRLLLVVALEEVHHPLARDRALPVPHHVNGLRVMPPSQHNLIGVLEGVFVHVVHKPLVALAVQRLPARRIQREHLTYLRLLRQPLSVRRHDSVEELVEFLEVLHGLAERVLANDVGRCAQQRALRLQNEDGDGLSVGRAQRRAQSVVSQGRQELDADHAAGNHAEANGLELLQSGLGLHSVLFLEQLAVLVQEGAIRYV